MPRPTGVTVIAIILFLAAGYLVGLAVIMLVSPGLISMAAGAPLLHGLELAGPYMFLLIGALGALVGYGLWRMYNWARRVTTLLGFVGIVMLIPSVSGSVLMMQFGNLYWAGLGVIVRVVIVWYLYQTPVAEEFARAARSK